MARGIALSETGAKIALLVEQMVPPSLCAITLVHHDGRHLKPLAAPSLGQQYFTSIGTVEIAPNCGSAGAAAFRREPVFAADTANDPKWRSLQDFTQACDVRASWALPILHHDGSVLGVLSLYYRQPREPQDWDWSALNSCIKLIRLALAADRRERDLRATDTRWRVGAETLGLGTFDVDFRSGTDKWSPTMYQILGLPDDAEPSFQTFVALVDPEDRKSFLPHGSDAPLPPAGGLWRKEVRIRRADSGETRVVLTQGCIIPSEDGQPHHAVGTLFDITDQRRHEQELEKAKTAAEAANRAKSRFLAAMSHELRTPLNAIIGFSDMIVTRVFGQVSPPRYESYVEDIHKSGTHLLSLINDVLDMAKIEAQKFELVRTVFPLHRLADNALLLVRPQAQARDISLTSDLADPNLPLHADERAMRQVLVNILSNAVKFTAPGGTVRLFAEPTAEGGLALGVEDNGEGMDPDGIAKALEPFGQIQRDVTAERTGTGLGLPLAKAMIEQHGARFRIQSKLGTGTRIWAEFPPSALTHTIRNAS